MASRRGIETEAVHSEGDAIDLRDGSMSVNAQGHTCYMMKSGAGRDGVVCGNNCATEGILICLCGPARIDPGARVVCGTAPWCGPALSRAWFPERRSNVRESGSALEC